MRKILLDIAQSGVLAPSADNNHVFKLEVLERKIRIWPSVEFAETNGRLRRVLGLISIGAVLENMRLRAVELGMTPTISWFPSSKGGPIVDLDLQSACNVIPEDLAAYIPLRHTNRRLYQGPELTPVENAQLTSAAESIEGVKIVWLTGANRRKALGLIWRAESERFRRKSLHEDLFSSVRFDLTWNQTTDKGLPPAALEIEPPMRPLFKALRHWSVMQPMTWIGIHWLIGLRAGWLPCWQAPALGVLTTTSTLEQGALHAGQALERLWLRATQLDLAFQPFAAAAVLQLQSNEDLGASPKLRAMLAAGWSEIVRSTRPIIIFRLGHADAPKLKTERRPLETYFR